MRLIVSFGVNCDAMGYSVGFIEKYGEISMITDCCREVSQIQCDTKLCWLVFGHSLLSQ